MHITADDRERGSGVIEALASTPGVTVDVERLPAGDYLVDGRLLFERKTLWDLAQSLIDGRLFRQARQLLRTPCHTAYILEGTSRQLAARRIHRESLQGAIVTLTVVLRFPVLRSLNTGETARLICSAGEQYGRSIHGAVQRPGYRPRGKRKRQLYVLQGLPGIGPQRAQSLLDAFGSIEHVMLAEEEELAEVQGIGAGTARAIRNLVR